MRWDYAICQSVLWYRVGELARVAEQWGCLLSNIIPEPESTADTTSRRLPSGKHDIMHIMWSNVALAAIRVILMHIIYIFMW